MLVKVGETREGQQACGFRFSRTTGRGRAGSGMSLLPIRNWLSNGLGKWGYGLRGVEGLFAKRSNPQESQDITPLCECGEIIH
jgi:hypothetical protein